MASYTLRASKRRRIKDNDPLREDDVMAQDTRTVERIVVQTKKGPVERKKFIQVTEASTSTRHVQPTATVAEEIQMPEIDQVYADDMEHNPDYRESDDIHEAAAAPQETRKVSFFRIMIHKIYISVETNIPKGIR
jgi:hypothetical protein